MKSRAATRAPWVTQLHTWVRTYWVWGLVALFWLLTVPSLATDHHYLRNLEPYPDGLYYTGPARELAAGRGLQLRHQLHTLKVQVPPLYSLSLVPAFVLSPDPAVFVVVNVLLGTLTLILLAQAIRLATGQWWWGLVGGLLYVLHGYVSWLVTVPMAENLSLALVAFLGWQMARRQHAPRDVLSVVVAAGALVLTRYNLAPVAVIMGLVFVLRWWQSGPARWWVGMLVGGASVAAAFGLFQFWWLGVNPLLVLQPQYEVKSATTIVAFSPAYLMANAKFYLWSLGGSPTRFLWQIWPLTTPALLLLAVGGAVRAWGQGRDRWVIGLAGAALLTQFGFQSFFYTADARYLWPIWPLILILVGIGLAEVARWRGMKVANVLAGVVLALLILSQLGFYRQIMAANWLQRSEAWQYRSVLTFNEFLADKPSSYLITALPPYLVDMYRQGNYVLLPLSNSQEFMNPSQRPWGELPYDDLAREYQRLLQAGQPVYATNAYLSSQAVLGQDWQRLAQQFRLEPVHEGCLGTCTIYQLQLP